jgi:hypothetical protein
MFWALRVKFKKIPSPLGREGWGEGLRKRTVLSISFLPRRNQILSKS